MEFLSDDPTYLAGGLGLLAGAFLVAMKLTQQGKYLVWAGVAFALALAVVAVERVWVTDNERIEETVYGLGRAVKASDASGVLDRLTPDVQYVAGGTRCRAPATRALIEQGGEEREVRLPADLAPRANAGGQSRRGRAEFRVICGGSFQGPSQRPELRLGQLDLVARA